MENMHYLVDTENVGTAWRYLSALKPSIRAIDLFYTQNSLKLSYDDLLETVKCIRCCNVIRCYTGTNALDFQLVSHLGYLLRTLKKRNYIILSNDTGFDAVVKHWTDRGYHVFRQSTVQLHKLVQSEPQTLQEVLTLLLIDFHKIDFDQLSAILMSISDCDNQTVYTTLLKSYGQSVGADIYRILKPYLPKLFTLATK